MRLSGRLRATIAVLEDFERRRVPLKTAIADWARGARYAGARDRAFVAGLALDVLRRRRTLAAAMGETSARAATLAALRAVWGAEFAKVAEAAAEAPHGPGALSAIEAERLGALASCEDLDAAAMSAGALADWPDWLAPEIRRAFGAGAAREMSAMAARAAVDLRINTLRIEPDKAMKALAHVGAEPHPLLRAAARIPAPPARERAPDVTVIPAFHKGWVEVQDGASQIAAAAAGNIKGAQVLDYCAGGGGKTLALAALMENTGQIFAYDSDARRLKPLYERARRAGVRNIQIVDPREDAARLAELKGRMDVVFLDAPCSGSGVWRRHPDAKWRLTEAQLHRRMAEQDAALAAGADFVRPGGRLVYATCSIFPAENEDRIAAFLAARPEFAETCACDAVASSGGLTAAGRDLLAACRRVSGALQITPYRTRTDGFYVATLVRR